MYFHIVLESGKGCGCKNASLELWGKQVLKSSSPKSFKTRTFEEKVAPQER